VVAGAVTEGGESAAYRQAQIIEQIIERRKSWLTVRCKTIQASW
jgi:hypothetical protein